MFFYYLMIFLFPFQNHPILSAEIGGLSTVKIAGGLALIYAIFSSFDFAQKPKKSKSIMILFTFFLLSFLISSFINSVPLNVRYGHRFISVLLLLVCTVLLIRNIDQISKIILMLLISMDISTLYLIKQYLGGLSRPGATFGDCNYYAISAAFAIGLSLVIGKHIQQRKIFYHGSTILNSIGLVLSGSRGGVLGVGVAIVYLCWISKNKIRNFFIFALSGIILIFVVPNNLVDRFNNTDIGAQTSTEHRLKLIKIGWELFEENVGFGIGPGNYILQSADFFENPDKRRIAHNTYIEVLAELGLAGFLSFLGLCYCSIRQFQRGIKGLKLQGQQISEFEIFTNALLIGFIGYLIGAIFLSVEYEKILWLCFSLAAVINSIPQTSYDGRIHTNS